MRLDDLVPSTQDVNAYLLADIQAENYQSVEKTKGQTGRKTH